MNDRKKDLRLLKHAVAIQKAGDCVRAAGIYHRLYDKHLTGDIADACVFYSSLNAHTMRGIAPDHFPAELAIRMAEWAVLRRPEMPSVWYNLGCMYQEVGRALEAKRCYEEAIKGKPDFAAAWGNLGNAYLDLGNHTRARWCYDEALKQEPDTPEDRYNRALVMLLLGQYETGWRDYEARWELPMWVAEHGRPELQGPRWGGEPFDGKLLLHCEQGHGDTFMVSRWVPRVRVLVGHLVLQVQPGVGRLYADQFEDVEVVEYGQAPPCDRWATSMSLPYLLRVRVPDDVRVAA